MTGSNVDAAGRMVGSTREVSVPIPAYDSGRAGCVPRDAEVVHVFDKLLADRRHAVGEPHRRAQNASGP